MIDCFAGLRHYTIVGGDDQDGNVGRLSAAGTHFCEGCVTRRVDERNQPIVGRGLVCADTLRDAAGLAIGHVCAADVIQERGFAVVDMSEHSHDRRPLAQVRRIVFLLLHIAEDVDG